MSKIDKLQILGIRSFDQRIPMSIQFQAPLTLIVGMNGSGKTTIIECLKYVTTGELPPNAARGASFIHDPSLANEKEVLAQVKVSFTSVEGVRMVCTRNMQLTVKKNARTVKSLEGSIRMTKDGEKNTLSSRVYEMNTMMPRVLGVSKAILEDVIFCHQEDSLWPMSEPKVLKEKFDKIFEALKYTKAIENIKIMQKHHRVELRVLEEAEGAARSNSEKAKKLKANKARLTEQVIALEAQKDDFGNQWREAHEKAEEIWEKAGTARDTVGILNGKRIARDTKAESVKDLRETLHELLDGTDEELQQSLDEHEERVQTYQVELTKQKNDYRQLQADLEDARGQLSSKERETGSYEAQKESFDRQIQQRKRLVQETARSYDIRGYDFEIDDAQVKAFMDHISRLDRDQQANFERARAEAQEELTEQQQKLTALNETTSAKNQAKTMAKQTMANYDNKVRALQAEQNKLFVDEGGKATLESQLQGLQNQLSSAKSDLNTSAWKSMIETADADIRRLEEHKDKLDTEYAEAARHAGDSAQLDFVRKELGDRQHGLTTMQNAHGDKIGKELGPGWKTATLEHDYQRAVNERATQLTEAERQRNGTDQELQFLNSKLRERKAAVKSAEQEQKSAEDKIYELLGCTPDGFREEVSALEQERDGYQADQGHFQALQDYLQQVIKTAKEHNMCRTCKRGFEGKHAQQDQQAMIKNIEDIIAKRKPKDDVETALQQCEDLIMRAKALSSDYENWDKNKHKTIPALRLEVAGLEADRDELVKRLEAQDLAVDARKASKSDIDALSRTVQSVIKYFTEISNFEAQIKELSAKQKQAGLSRGIEAIQADIKQANEEAKTARSHHAEATNSHNRTETRISSLELQISNLKGKLKDAEYQLQQMGSLQAQEAEYKDLIVEQRNNLTNLESELREISAKQSTEQTKYDEITRRRGDQDRDLQDKASKLSNSVEKLKMAEEEIRAYHDRGGHERLKRSRREVDDAKAAVARIKEESDATVKEVKMLDERLRDTDETKHSIINNQRFRRDLKALDDLEVEIKDLERTNVEADKEKYEREAARWQSRRNEAASKQATVTGQLTSVHDNLRQLDQDWATDYANAGRKYREAHIKVETTKAAINDLGIYAGALDKAIMKYHSLKMDAINDIIRDLWSKTYQGTDVDTILIRSETETLRANRNYAYRVCMVKQETEMDMRGRCSAGQKVLASIIIRLALADCFGVNCGMIALDEPTTNLDRDNVMALARSLSEIIALRRAQRNFQLIVITHDEDFLKAMNASEYTDNYFRVYRGSEQQSCIDKQSIQDIM